MKPYHELNEDEKLGYVIAEAWTEIIMKQYHELKAKEQKPSVRPPSKKPGKVWGSK